MNLGGLRELVRTRLDDLVEPFLWSDEFLNGSINRALDDAIIRIGGVDDEYTPSITLARFDAAQSVVFLDPRVIKVESVRYGDRALPIVSEVSISAGNPSWAAEFGVPMKVMLTKGGLRLYPIPSDSGVLGVSVRRSALSPLLLDSQVPEIPVFLHPYLLYAVQAEAYSLPDADISDPEASIKFDNSFTQCFGPRPSAKYQAQWARTPVNSTVHQRRM